jgi:hypothetical protein
MGKFEGINRNYSTSKEGSKTPEEKQRELDKAMKEFFAKGGKVQKIPANITKQTLEKGKF